jgi:hypothetical protein
MRTAENLSVKTLQFVILVLFILACGVMRTFFKSIFIITYFVCVQEDLIKKIEYMGALFSSKLVGGTTHLVAKNVLSIKYEVSHAVGLC